MLPVLLVVSQYVSQKVISPPSTDPSQQSTQWILKFLPLMIGTSTGHAFFMLAHSCGDERALAFLFGRDVVPPLTCVL